VKILNALSLLTSLVPVSQSVASEHTSKGDFWVAAGSMSQPRLGHSMAEFPSGPNALGLSTGRGKVMVIGGSTASLYLHRLSLEGHWHRARFMTRKRTLGLSRRRIQSLQATVGRSH
jgi:hypothetical protein